MPIGRFAFVAAVMSFTTLAFAQESEFQGKIQEDMDGYKKQFADNCGANVTMKYSGKLGSNPRETKDGNYSAVSSLCTAGLDAVAADFCQNNKVIKAAMSKVTSVTCTTGKGTLGYRLKGGALTFMVDPVFKGNNVSSQESDLVQKMKNDLDK